MDRKTWAEAQFQSITPITTQLEVRTFPVVLSILVQEISQRGSGLRSANRTPPERSWVWGSVHMLIPLHRGFSPPGRGQGQAASRTTPTHTRGWGHSRAHRGYWGPWAQRTAHSCESCLVTWGHKNTLGLLGGRNPAPVKIASTVKQCLEFTTQRTKRATIQAERQGQPWKRGGRQNVAATPWPCDLRLLAGCPAGWIVCGQGIHILLSAARGQEGPDRGLPTQILHQANNQWDLPENNEWITTTLACFTQSCDWSGHSNWASWLLQPETVL